MKTLAACRALGARKLCAYFLLGAVIPVVILVGLAWLAIQ